MQYFLTVSKFLVTQKKGTRALLSSFNGINQRTCNTIDANLDVDYLTLWMVYLMDIETGMYREPKSTSEYCLSTKRAFLGEVGVAFQDPSLVTTNKK